MNRSSRIAAALAVGLALMAIGIESTGAAELPALPRVFIDTTYSLPKGKTIAVDAGGDLQAAVDRAAPGDTIVLEAGATYGGPITLPNKAGSGWIYIQSSSYAKLPPPGSRVSMADAVNMPRIVGPGWSVDAIRGWGVEAINTKAQAHHFRFVGIEIAPANGKFIKNLVNIGNREKSVADLPHDITFDRCYIHGDPDVGGRRGVAMNGVSLAVIDSYVSDFKEVGADTQALWTANTPGPLKIVNNFLEAAGENFMSGGADPTIANVIPSDMEIRRNHFFKPLSWMSSNWSVKNLIEFKSGQRILVEGNTFENIWAAAQTGGLMVAKSSNQDGKCTWCVTQHLTVRFNRGVNLENGFQLGGPEGVALLMNHVLIEHNVLEITRPNNGGGQVFLIVRGPRDMTIRHNTGLILSSGGTAGLSENSPKSERFDFRDNLLSNGDYGFAGTGAGSGTTVLDRYFREYLFVGNAIIGGGPIDNYPRGNFFPRDPAAVGFVDFARGNYRLAPTSPLHNAASDGHDVGADIDMIDMAIGGGRAVSAPSSKYRH